MKKKKDAVEKSTKKSDKPKKANSSQSLAVKYRPRVIDDLVGQDAVAVQIRGMIKSGRFPSTIGLFGESGGGKTTASRLIARYINCAKPNKDNGSPCGECVSCSFVESHPDVHEINMANQRGIDDARDLINSARSMPTVGNKRVFILDEMHACFPGETKILLANGHLESLWNIGERLANGETVKVMSFNHEDGTFEPKKVTHFLPKKTTADRMCTTYVEQMGCLAHIDSTVDHKIWNESSGDWCEAGALEKGNQLKSNINIATTVRSVRTHDEDGASEDVMDVYDLTVEDNHNYLVMPIGGTHPVLVSNCTPQALQSFLKPLEEPPEHTIWILATTNPEKLPGTILGRCHKFHIKPIAPEVIIKRLRVIAKKEGVDFKEMEGGGEVLSTIANLSNGRMRDSISSLESVLFAIRSGDQIDAKRLISDFATTAEADLDKMSGRFLAALVSGDAKVVIQCIIDAKNARGLINKTRWLLQTIINQAVDRPHFKTYSWRCFMDEAKKAKVSPRLSVMLKVQDLLCTIEMQLNSVSIDETVLFTSRVGTYLAENKSK